jgi:hypothetical protein
MLVAGIASGVPGQELVLSTSGKTCAAGEQAWVNLSVLKAEIVPGAYTVSVAFDTGKVTYATSLAAETSPFYVTPAVFAKSGTVTVAGFQGIADTGKGTASLVTLVFKGARDGVLVDTSTFSVVSAEVFTAQGHPMELTVTEQASSVLLPPDSRLRRQAVFLAHDYVRFSVPKDGVVSVRIFALNGRTVAEPLAPCRVKAGSHAVAIGARLRSGVYVIAVRGAGMNAVKKVEVVR